MKVSARDRFVEWADSSAYANRFSFNKNIAKWELVSDSAWANKLPILHLLLCICALMLTGGCDQPETTNIKKSRTIAAENIELRKDLDRRNKEIKTLKEQFSEKIDEQREQLRKCLKEKEELKEKSRQNVREQVSSVLDTVMEENRKLREENTRLKAQIEELKKERQ